MFVLYINAIDCTYTYHNRRGELSLHPDLLILAKFYFFKIHILVLKVYFKVTVWENTIVDAQCLVMTHSKCVY